MIIFFHLLIISFVSCHTYSLSFIKTFRFMSYPFLFSIPLFLLHFSIIQPSLCHITSSLSLPLPLSFSLSIYLSILHTHTQHSLSLTLFTVISLAIVCATIIETYLNDKGYNFVQVIVISKLWSVGIWFLWATPFFAIRYGRDKRNFNANIGTAPSSPISPNSAA